jgi:cation diffusion facilitator CzcD-associated flavoprotein CzcO
VAVVGAGPYGLSIAAHLRGRGLEVAAFGKPMQFWREHMPQGMLLRSFWWATSLSDPCGQYTLGHYLREQGQQPVDPLPGTTIAEYGTWFQQQAVPQLDTTYVASVRSEGHHRFVIDLADGRVLYTAAVVMAPGLQYYAARPAQYAQLPGDLVSHTADHRTFDRFAHKRVAVIGGGQSALETAALLHESGVQAHLIHRSPLVWLSAYRMANRTLIERVRYPKAAIAPGWFNWAFEHMPYTFNRLPQPAKEWVLQGHGRHGPAGAHWLKPRIEGKVMQHALQQPLAVRLVGDRVALTLSDDRVLEVDHVILGTGYRLDIGRLPMLHPALLARVRGSNDAPTLDGWFESSVPGLYFVGFSTLYSHGPLYRFVVGTDAAAQRVATAVARQLGARSTLSDRRVTVAAT